eukprot:COSAG03_NODE_2644_length_2566_cov_10.483989_2_plen_431_part_00
MQRVRRVSEHIVAPRCCCTAAASCSEPSATAAAAASSALLLGLAAELEARAQRVSAVSVVAGFDAFVDEFFVPVDRRQSPTAFDPVPSIAAFAEQLAKAAGQSATREIVASGSSDSGGNSVNLSDGLNALGAQTHLFATVGDPMHPAFVEVASGCASVECFAGLPPGRSICLEFGDGKVMLNSVASFAQLDGRRLAAALANSAFLAACQDADAICLSNWTMFPFMTECWQLLRAELAKVLRPRVVPRLIFVDVTDPAGRSDADVREMLTELAAFRSLGTTALGVNLNEANRFARLSTGVPQVASEAEGPGAAAAQAAALRTALGVDVVVIHCMRFAALADDGGGAPVWEHGCFTEAPRRSTGAGDRFNAGWVLGACLQLPPRQQLLLGSAVSGFFVRHARSPALLTNGDSCDDERGELASFLTQWAQGTL